MPKVTKSLKGITAKRANAISGLTGSSFRQEESYNRLVRNETESRRIVRYIEMNAVRAGLVPEAGEYRWSSAGWGASVRLLLGVGESVITPAVFSLSSLGLLCVSGARDIRSAVICEDCHFKRGLMETGQR